MNINCAQAEEMMTWVVKYKELKPFVFPKFSISYDAFVGKAKELEDRPKN